MSIAEMMSEAILADALSRPDARAIRPSEESGVIRQLCFTVNSVVAGHRYEAHVQEVAPRACAILFCRVTPVRSPSQQIGRLHRRRLSHMRRRNDPKMRSPRIPIGFVTGPRVVQVPPKLFVGVEHNIGSTVFEMRVGKEMPQAEIHTNGFCWFYIRAHGQSTVFCKINGQAGTDQTDSILETQRSKKRPDELPLPLMIPIPKRAFVLLEQFLHVRVFDAILSKDFPPSFRPFVPNRLFGENARQRQESALRIIGLAAAVQVHLEHGCYLSRPGEI